MHPNKINDLGGRKSLFTLQYEATGTKVVHEFDGEINLYEALEQIEQFLLGCGYRFTGTLDIVNDENPPEVISVSTQTMLLE